MWDSNPWNTRREGSKCEFGIRMRGESRISSDGVCQNTCQDERETHSMNILPVFCDIENEPDRIILESEQSVTRS